MRIDTSKGKSKFDETIKKAVDDGETSVTLGNCGFVQLAHVTVDQTGADVNVFKLDKTGNEKELTLTKKSLISARIKALVRALPTGQYDVASKDGSLNW